MDDADDDEDDDEALVDQPQTEWRWSEHMKGTR
jgi:hypothetical protein